MNSTLKWRVPLVLAILGVCLFYAIPPFDPDGPGPRQGKIKLGLDLQGGMQLILRVDTAQLPAKDRGDASLRAIEIIRNRIDQFGVSEPTIQQTGNDRILVQLPGVTDRERALALIGKTALLEFKLVSDDSDLMKKAVAGEATPGFKLYESEGEGRLLVEEETLMTGKELKDAQVNFGQYNEPVVAFEFSPDGGKQFSEITGANINRRLAIILDGKIQSAPRINSQIGDRGIIEGRFTMDEAGDLSIVLRAGALPAPIVVEEERSVGASLGKDSVQQGIRATYVGFGLVVAFMAAYYLFAGLVANLALAFNILIIMAALAYFKATLTLPGIAGIVLTIGMAVDTNVLIFERIREELALKKPVAASIAAGYKKAFTAIFDSNLTTLITALILYNIGTGPVRGFALTLSIGLLASMFTGIAVTRMVFDLLLAKGSVPSMKMLQFIHQTPKVNFLKWRKWCYAASIALIAVGVFGFVKRGPTMFGVDFSGGTMIEYKFEKPVQIDEMRKSLAAVDEGTAAIQKLGDTNQFILRTAADTEPKITAELKKSFPDNPVELLRLESVGPIVGKELKTKALWAFILSLVAIWGYVVWRFDFRFAFGAILAIFHDGLIAIGAVALTGRELSVTVLAAVLTIIGFSINDTIVIFDRIRERRRLGAKETFEEAINVSVNQTMSRTILTTFTVLIVVSSLFFFGGEVINDFAFTILVGLISGTYSTVYIAAPVLVDWPGSKKSVK